MTTVKTTIKIGKVDYDILEKDLPINDLKFYSENPRIYSHFNISMGELPSQAEIKSTLSRMDHVKQLKLSIESNGGLIDPIIVRDGDYVVLEGNSRLAAYFLLAEIDPIKWGLIRCKILPKNISDSAIFALLGQYHIISRKDWSPFEQAGYLYRRHSQTKLPIETMASELGITKGKAEKYIEVYQFMHKWDDAVPERWSYYEEFLKNTSLKKARVEFPEVEKTVVDMIKSNDIHEASDIRKLGEMAKQVIDGDTDSKKTFQKVIAGKQDFYDAYDELRRSGKFDGIIRKISKIQKTVFDDDFREQILNHGDPGEIKYYIKKITQKLTDLLNSLDRNE